MQHSFMLIYMGVSGLIYTEPKVIHDHASDSPHDLVRSKHTEKHMIAYNDLTYKWKIHTALKVQFLNNFNWCKEIGPCRVC